MHFNTNTVFLRIIFLKEKPQKGTSSYIILLETAFLMKYWETRDYTLDVSNWWFETALTVSTYKGTLNHAVTIKALMAHPLFKIRSLPMWKTPLLAGLVWLKEQSDKVAEFECHDH